MEIKEINIKSPSKRGLEMKLTVYQGELMPEGALTSFM